MVTSLFLSLNITFFRPQRPLTGTASGVDTLQRRTSPHRDGEVGFSTVPNFTMMVTEERQRITRFCSLTLTVNALQSPSHLQI